MDEEIAEIVVNESIAEEVMEDISAEEVMRESITDNFSKTEVISIAGNLDI